MGPEALHQWTSRGLVVLATWATVMFAHPAMAAASCGESTPAAVLFEGRAIGRTEPTRPGDDTIYRWRVERALAGVPEGAEVDVRMAVIDEPVEVSSVDIGPAPLLGPTYRVGAYRGGGSLADALFTNACGGTLQLIDAAPVTSRPTGRLAALTLALGTAIAVGLVVSRRVRRR